MVKTTYGLPSPVFQNIKYYNMRVMTSARVAFLSGRAINRRDCEAAEEKVDLALHSPRFS
jgi:hypothetical protein